MKNADMPAMPVVTVQRVGNVEKSTSEATGLTKREMMAMHMLSGLLAAPFMKNETPDQLTVSSVIYADKLLAELERTAK